MGKAFVAKLAAEGAHNPEALAAWIGRHKHGKAAFAKLSAAGRKAGDGKGGKGGDSGPSKDSAAAAEAAREAGAHARLREATARRAAIRENRPAEVTRDVEALASAQQRYSSGLGGGSIRRVANEKIAELYARLSRLMNADPASFSRQEASMLTHFGHTLRGEINRRRSGA